MSREKIAGGDHFHFLCYQGFLFSGGVERGNGRETEEIFLVTLPGPPYLEEFNLFKGVYFGGVFPGLSYFKGC